MILRNPNGITVKQLKLLLRDWPEVNEYTGEDCEVWIETEENLSSPATEAMPLNKRVDDGVLSADLILKAGYE